MNWVFILEILGFVVLCYLLNIGYKRILANDDVPILNNKTIFYILTTILGLFAMGGFSMMLVLLFDTANSFERRMGDYPIWGQVLVLISIAVFAFSVRLYLHKMAKGKTENKK